MSEQTGTPPDVPRDEEIARLVRDVAEPWTMPPQRLGEATWRDRVDARRSSRSRGWLTRFGRAAAIAVAATVVLALAAVWLNMPASTGPAVPGATPEAAVRTGTSTVAPHPTLAATPSATPLPSYARYGSVPAPGTIVVDSGSALQSLDLATGALGAPVLTSADVASPLLSRPGGGYVCACARTVQAASTDGLAVTMTFYDAAGRVTDSFRVGSGAMTYGGAVDPAVTGAAADQGASAVIGGTLSADGRYFFLSWMQRRPPSWQRGVDVVDLQARRVVQSARLPDAPSSVQGSAVYPGLPDVAIAPDARHLVVAVVSGVDGSSQQWFVAPLDGARLGAYAPFAAGSGTLAGCVSGGGSVLGEGFATSTSYYALCGEAGGSVVLRRVDLTGAALGDTPLTGIGSDGLPGEAARIVDARSRSLYVWNAFGATLVRLDLRTGQVTGSVQAPKPAATLDDPLDLLGAAARAVGSWIAPTATAKLYLNPAIALSPDGTRLYALSVNGSSPLDPNAGSGGVWVFDATTLTVVDHWQPAADYVSIALSPDGSVAYIAAMSGVDAAGQPSGQQASVTVVDTRTGAVRLICGALGDGFLDVAPGRPFNSGPGGRCPQPSRVDSRANSASVQIVPATATASETAMSTMAASWPTSARAAPAPMANQAAATTTTTRTSSAIVVAASGRPSTERSVPGTTDGRLRPAADRGRFSFAAVAVASGVGDAPRGFVCIAGRLGSGP